MSTRLSCERARELAPELALRIISGDERAELIAHTARCVQCRKLIEDLSVTADHILLVAPEHEPPAGFESGVLAQIRAPARVPRRAWFAAVAAIIAAAATAGGLWWATAADRDLASHYRAALEEADGEYFGAKPLRSASGKVGNTFAYEGTPSWLFVVFEDTIDEGTYIVEMETTDGTVVDLGSFELSDPGRTWGTHIDTKLLDVRTLRFSGLNGATFETSFVVSGD